MARKVTDQLDEEGIHMLDGTVIKSVEKLEERKFLVELETKRGSKVTTHKEEVNTILVAIGRDPNPLSYGADKLGIALDPHSRKILGRPEEPERTSIDHIYAVGDIVQGVPELMPVA
jgi:pyruvate/2-oxoglutarate dehydrogenase complex dihydrolipoamide dehydrogenase (E3) component